MEILLERHPYYCTKCEDSNDPTPLFPFTAITHELLIVHDKLNSNLKLLHSVKLYMWILGRILAPVGHNVTVRCMLAYGLLVT